MMGLLILCGSIKYILGKPLKRPNGDYRFSQIKGFVSENHDRLACVADQCLPLATRESNELLLLTKSIIFIGFLLVPLASIRFVRVWNWLDNLRVNGNQSGEKYSRVTRTLETRHSPMTRTLETRESCYVTRGRYCMWSHIGLIDI